MTATKCFLGLGSNIETDSSSRYDFLYSGIRQLAQHEHIQVKRASNVYETQPVGYEDQESFYNTVIEISTTLSPQELLAVCLDVVEKRAGRIRNIKDGPRTLDVDILLYGNKNVNDEGLIIPHPRMYQRAFVMIPLAQIAPNVVGELSQYDFVDDVDGVKKLEDNFDALIEKYRER